VPGPVSLAFILESVAPMIGSQKPRVLWGRVNIVLYVPADNCDSASSLQQMITGKQDGGVSFVTK
jgi:hypothetical protein